MIILEFHNFKIRNSGTPKMREKVRASQNEKLRHADFLMEFSRIRDTIFEILVALNGRPRLVEQFWSFKNSNTPKFYHQKSLNKNERRKLLENQAKIIRVGVDEFLKENRQ